MITASTDHQHSPLQHVGLVISWQLIARMSLPGNRGKSPHDSYGAWTQGFPCWNYAFEDGCCSAYTGQLLFASLLPVTVTLPFLLWTPPYTLFIPWVKLTLSVPGMGLWPRLCQWDILWWLVQGGAMTWGGPIKVKPWPFLELLGKRRAAVFLPWLEGGNLWV